jgi:hypothetical protein
MASDTLDLGGVEGRARSAISLSILGQHRNSYETCKLQKYWSDRYLHVCGHDAIFTHHDIHHLCSESRNASVSLLPAIYLLHSKIFKNVDLRYHDEKQCRRNAKKVE